MADDPFSDSSYHNVGLSPIDTQAIIRKIRPNLDKTLLEVIEKNLPDLHGDNRDVLFLDDVTTTEDHSQSTPVALLVGRIRINDVLRLNRFLMFCTRRMTMGGFIVLRYMPLENVIKDFKRRYTGLLYWMGQRRHGIDEFRCDVPGIAEARPGPAGLIPVDEQDGMALARKRPCCATADQAGPDHGDRGVLLL